LREERQRTWSRVFNYNFRFFTLLLYAKLSRAVVLRGPVYAGFAKRNRALSTRKYMQNREIIVISFSGWDLRLRGWFSGPGGTAIQKLLLDESLNCFEHFFECHMT